MFVLYIKKYRELRKMSQQELGDLIGKTQQHISLLESDNIIRKRSVKLNDLELIAQALNVCCNDLIHYKCSNECHRFNKCNKQHEHLDENDDFFKQHLQFYI